MAAKSRKKSDLYKEKGWYPIHAPEEYNRVKIGETLTNDPAKLDGRMVVTTLAELTGDWQKQNVKMAFKVDEVSESGAYTRFVGHELTRDYMRSLVKRRTSKIGGNVVVETKDGMRMRIKPVIYTVKRAQTSKQKGMRAIMEGIVMKQAREVNYLDLVAEIVGGKLSSDIYKDVRLVYPVRRVEVEKSQVLGKVERRRQGTQRKVATEKTEAPTGGA